MGLLLVLFLLNWYDCGRDHSNGSTWRRNGLFCHEINLAMAIGPFLGLIISQNFDRFHDFCGNDCFLSCGYRCNDIFTFTKGRNGNKRYSKRGRDCI